MQTFSKNERLTSKKRIDTLFDKGNSFNIFPLKIIWMPVLDEAEKLQVLFSVPKKIHKRAVDRNRIKRLLRETYRKNKNTLYEGIKDKKLALAIVYLDKEIADYQLLNDKMILLIQRLLKEIQIS